MMKINNKKGFSLIEAILVFSIISVVALLMYAFFGQGFNLYSVEAESADEQMNLRQVMSDITNNARLTSKSNITYSSGTLNVDSDSYILSGTDLYRNITVLAKDIAAFNVTINNDILEISIVNTSGTSLRTSLSLIEESVNTT